MHATRAASLGQSLRCILRRLKAGEQAGFPRFKSRNRWHSFEFTYGDGCKLRFDANKRALLHEMNVGELKVKYHRSSYNFV